MLLSSSQDHPRPADSSRGRRLDHRPDHRSTGVTPAACMARKRSALAAAGFVPCRMRIPASFPARLQNLKRQHRRSEERRVGKELVSKGKSRLSPDHLKKKTKKT